MSPELLRGLTSTAALCAALILTPAVGRTQAPTGEQRAATASANVGAVRARQVAQEFEAQALVLTVFDRQGRVVTTVGERGIYFQPIFSPDRTRLAVMKSDLEIRTNDLWVLDVATGRGTLITRTHFREPTRWPVWSPDGSQLAYVALRDGFFGVYRKAASGEGPEELLYKHPGGPMFLLDWSMDGRFLGFSASDLSGGTVYALPTDGAGERKPIEVLRSQFQAWGASFSPGGRFVSYASLETGTNETWVRPFDPSARAAATSAAGAWRVSDQGGYGSVYWRQDGKEMYYFAAGRGVMAVEVDTAPRFTFGKPKLLFRLSEAIPTSIGQASVSRDGERVVIAVPAAPTLAQITVFDRQGFVLRKVGEPGRIRNPALSPDGTRVAAIKKDPLRDSANVWTFDVASGKSRAVTNGGQSFGADNLPDNFPIWSPDGSQVAYVSRRGKFTSIYRKAWDGSGNEERLFQYTPGADMRLTDWSADGKLMTFHDGCDGVLQLLTLDGNQNALERKAIEWLRDEYNVAQARLSPDGRYMAYLSNEGKTSEEIEAEISEVYVRPFDAGAPAGSAKPAQVSTTGAVGMIFWRQDGKELYYLTPDREVMAVEVTTAPTFRSGTPRLLFKVPGLWFGNPAQWKNVSADGQRFVFAINVPASVSAR